MMEIQVKVQRILVVVITVIIITHGREELLSKCLDSLPDGTVEWQLVLVANGKQLPLETTHRAQSLTPNLNLLHSPQLLTPGKARNLALAQATGEWVYFIDDDAYVTGDYWKTIGPILADPKVDVIGGPDFPARGMSAFPLSLAITLASPFCTGATFSRHRPAGDKMVPATEEKLTSCNLWVRRSALAGLEFPEDYQRAEESYLLQRLKVLGARIFYHPKLEVAHHRRSHLSQLWRPTFLAGFYRSKLSRAKLVPTSGMFWLPALFVLLHLLVLVDRPTFWSLTRLYAGVIVFASMNLAARARRFSLFPLIAFLHYYIVFLYGLGFLWERVRRWK